MGNFPSHAYFVVPGYQHNILTYLHTYNDIDYQDIILVGWRHSRGVTRLLCLSTGDSPAVRQTLAMREGWIDV